MRIFISSVITGYEDFRDAVAAGVGTRRSSRAGDGPCGGVRCRSQTHRAQLAQADLVTQVIP